MLTEKAYGPTQSLPTTSLKVNTLSLVYSYGVCVCFIGIDGAPSANASRLPISKGKADDDKTIALGVGLPVGFTCLAILILVATFAHKNKGKRKNRRKFSNPREENVNKLDSAYASFHKSLSNSLERISYADEYASNGIGSYRQTKVTTIV
eukprot:m.84026 g.84026  ORF g.84026 m.84026 type:complete len:151 (+) comp36381_c0_seq4:1828-2280(+)